METTIRSYGRSELAQQYFPHLKQISAWLKLKGLMLEYDPLVPLATMPRRTFTPREVATIFDLIGTP